MDSSSLFEARRRLKESPAKERLPKLLELTEQAREVYQTDKGSEWNQQALAWILYDTIMLLNNTHKKEEAAKLFNEFISIPACTTEQFLIDAVGRLKPKFTHGSDDVAHATVLSKAGKHDEALQIFRQLKKTGKLSVLHHEAYGWALQRKLQQQKNELGFTAQKKLLFEYIKLENERPSLLHSVILGYVVQLQPEGQHFDLNAFFELWGPENLRREDLKPSMGKDGTQYPSLQRKLIRAVLRFSGQPDPAYWVEALTDSSSWHAEAKEHFIVEAFREACFFKVHELKSSGKTAQARSFLNYYSKAFARYSHTESHSKLLSYAVYLFKEAADGSFYDFLKNWDPAQIAEADWHEQEKDGQTYPSTIVTSIRRAFAYVKQKGTTNENHHWLLAWYNEGVKRYPSNEWLLREHAMLLKFTGRTSEAIEAYQNVLKLLPDKEYVWGEFSECYADESRESLACLAKAVRISATDDYLGDIRLKLAASLVAQGYNDDARLQLQKYKKHRDEKGWGIPVRYAELNAKTGITEEGLEQHGNEENLGDLAKEAEELVYGDLPWIKMVHTKAFKTKEGKKRFAFSDGKNSSFTKNKAILIDLPKLKPGDVIEVRLFEKEKQMRPVMVRKTDDAPWKALQPCMGFVEYFNREKNILHLITNEGKKAFIEQQGTFNIGDAFSGFLDEIKKRDGTMLTQIYDMRAINQSEALENMPGKIAVVDSVNPQKKLFHVVLENNIDAIVPFSKTSLRPRPGDFVEIRGVETDGRRSGETMLYVFDARTTTETNDALLKEETGIAVMRYHKNGGQGSPDFAFLDNIYIHKNQLKKARIREDCMVKLLAVRDKRGKWRCLRIAKITVDEE